MIEKPFVGILAMLDEEVKMPRGSDANFLRKIIAKYERRREFGRTNLLLLLPAYLITQTMTAE